MPVWRGSGTCYRGRHDPLSDRPRVVSRADPPARGGGLQLRVRLCDLAQPADDAVCRLYGVFRRVLARHADRGVLARQLLRRRGPLLDRPALRYAAIRAISAARARRAGRGAPRRPPPRLDDPVPPLSARPARRRGLRLRHVAHSVADLPGAQLHCRRPVGLRGRVRRLCVRPALREGHERCLVGLRHRDAGGVPRPFLDPEPEARTGGGAS